MTKRELIERIRRMNPTARPEFLATFSEGELIAYLHQLQEVAYEQRRSRQAERRGRIDAFRDEPK